MVNTFPVSVRVSTCFVFLLKKKSAEMRLNIFPIYKNTTVMIFAT